MNTPYPEHTPPAPPEGMKWEYRGMGWNTHNITKFYVCPKVHFAASRGDYTVPLGHDDTHYFEAVPDPTPESDETLLETKYQVFKTVDLPSENPKESAGRKKCPMHLLSPSAMRETANALGSGAAKYGPRNYRTAGVNATTYVAAILRHVSAWNDGEDLDPESGLSHIAHAAACCDIILDTAACGKLNDDRSKKPA